MDWRRKELIETGTAVVAITREEAGSIYDRAISFCSRTRYGLDETKFSNIDRLDVDETGPETRHWLTGRIGNGDLLLVFGKELVFKVPAASFIENWQDMFCPSRDDVVILPVVGEWVLFYCHEDEFEFARI